MKWIISGPSVATVIQISVFIHLFVACESRASPVRVLHTQKLSNWYAICMIGEEKTDQNSRRPKLTPSIYSWMEWSSGSYGIFQLIYTYIFDQSLCAKCMLDWCSVNSVALLDIMLSMAVLLQIRLSFHPHTHANRVPRMWVCVWKSIHICIKSQNTHVMCVDFVYIINRTIACSCYIYGLEHSWKMLINERAR